MKNKTHNSSLVTNNSGRYFPQDIEAKWREVWKEKGQYKFQIPNPKSQEEPSTSLMQEDFSLSKRSASKGLKPRKYYTLVELPYPSGDLHIGHWFTFIAPDVLSRFKKMNGYSVFFPMGYDAFGLPAENAAIKHGVHPKDWTEKNIETMTRQFETMGTMIDWDHVTITCRPEYYKWNQWIFQKMYEKGLAYRGKTLSNWCPTDQTVLANEHVENGKCWRCGDTVVQKEVEQWFLKITDYAERLIWKEDGNGVDWPKSVMTAQNDWIGRSEGLLIEFPVIPAKAGHSPLHGGIQEDGSLIESGMTITVFTTRPETIDGASFLVIAPEHPLVASITTSEHKQEVDEYVEKAKRKTELERKEVGKEKTGVFSGTYVQNPVTYEQIPVWVADYVLSTYGTGAVMGVPSADERDGEFAKKYNLPMISTTFEAKPNGKKMVNYHLHDWSVSRQRYWGTPVPMIDCEKCGIVPVPEKDLPVELPYNVDYQPKGKAPLASNEKWLHVTCPKCGGDATRDPETLDTFFDSSWYYYRYVDPHYTKGPFESSTVERLMPIDIYFGGGEHTLGHTLYARFFTKFFHDLGMVDFDEFALKRVQHGIVLGPDGNKMSKSKGNVINPDDVVKEFGTDAVRVYLSFMMPYGATGPWSTTAMYGSFRFLKRIWELQTQISNIQYPISNEEKSVIASEAKQSQVPAMTQEDLFQMHRTIKKVTEDIEKNSLNTAVAALMEWLNYLEGKGSRGKGKVQTEEYKTLLLLLAPFAPHMTEELWQRVILNDSEGSQSRERDSSQAQNDPFQSIHSQKWPAVKTEYTTGEKFVIAVQVNGKTRDTISLPSKDATAQEKVEQKAKESAKIVSYIEGKAVKKVIFVPGKILNFVV